MERQLPHLELVVPLDEGVVEDARRRDRLVDGVGGHVLTGDPPVVDPPAVGEEEVGVILRHEVQVVLDRRRVPHAEGPGAVGVLGPVHARESGRDDVRLRQVGVGVDQEPGPGINRIPLAFTAARFGAVVRRFRVVHVAGELPHPDAGIGHDPSGPGCDGFVTVLVPLPVIRVVVPEHAAHAGMKTGVVRVDDPHSRPVHVRAPRLDRVVHG